MIERQLVRRAVRLHHRLAQPEQERPARLAVVHLLLEVLNPAAAGQRGQLRQEIALEHVLHHAGHELCRALDGLQQHIAGEAVRHDHVRSAERHVPRLDVADEVDVPGVARLLQQRIDRLLQLAALAVLRADVQKRHARPLHAEQLPRAIRSHECELQQKFRRAVRRRAAVDEHDAACGRRDNRTHGRTADALHTPHRQRRRREQRPRRSGGHECVPAAVAQHLQADNHRGLRLLFQNRRRVVVHVDDVVRIRDLHALRQRLDLMVGEGFEDLLPAPDEHDLRPQRLRCADRAERRSRRRVVAAHGVH